MMIAPVVGGLLAGAGHALSGPDHLAAVLPLALGRGRGAALSGFAWGLGHGLGLMVAGGAVLLGRAAFGAEALSGHAEILVGVVLLVTGLLSVRRAQRGAPPLGGGHSHRAAAGIGALHGVAGMSHLLVLFAALALPGPVAAAWLIAFTLGAAAAVGAAALAAQRLYRRSGPQLGRSLRLGGGLITAAVGAVWIALSLRPGA